MPDPQKAVIDLLSRAATFGVERVEQVETHASIVFLAGTHAYKLKKAIRYSYLDYSSVELRRAACAAEFEINRRFAPSLYLGVQPVVRLDTGDVALNGEGAPVDWVVVMARFDQAAQFDRKAEKHDLPIELMWPLADRIAEIHDAADIRPEFGGLGGLRKAIDITVENLRLAIDHGLARNDVETWTDRVLHALEGQAALLERRRVAGRVRACHGDLHLQNICLFENRPTLFDAIEFDAAISTTDTLYDLAFLLMDLHHRGLEAHANMVFNRYLDRRDETDGLAALPLFMSVRAAIRAQVTVAAALHHHAIGDVSGLVAQAQSYLALALELLTPSSPEMVVIGGLSGTGKSTLAYRLAPTLASVPGARVLRSDVVRKRIAGVSPETALPAEFYTPAAHDETYRHLMDEARTCLGAGRSVIVDAVFANDAERTVATSVAKETGVPFRGLWLEAPIGILEQRVLNRRNDASDAQIDVLHRQTNYRKKPADWLRLDANGLPETVAANALEALRDFNRN